MNGQPPAPLTVRPARPADGPVLYSFLCVLEDTVLDPQAFLAVLARNLANPAISYLVAIDRGVPVGFVSCHVQYLLHHTGPVAEIQELFVRPDYRRQAVGRLLLDSLLALPQARHWLSLEVTTNRRRTDATAFYEAQGFVATHLKLVKSAPL